MRNFTKNNVLAIVSSVALLFAACGDDSKNAGGSVEDQEIIAISDKTVTGVSQKGPFVNGSSVTVQELNGETLAQTGLGFEGKIKNDMGEFSVKVNKLESQYALLKANGFYRNEVTGEKSKSQVTLYALTDLSKRDEVNVNLLTHLAYERSLYLAAEEDSSVAGAKKQAETEVLKSFEIEGDFGDAEDLNIFGESDQSAALLAISVLMQGDLSEGDFSERLADYAADIESDGVWNDAKTATQIADWAISQSMSGGLAVIRNNIANWKLSADVPSFEKYVDNFWWQNYGLGECTDKREGKMLQNSNAKSLMFNVAFICNKNAWRVATALEYDTYEQVCDKGGEITKGNVSELSYLCDDKTWREADEVEAVLGGCVEKRTGEVNSALGIYYICENREWRLATDIEMDTYKWKDGKDGDVKFGDVVKTNCYVYEEGSWRSGYESDCTLELRGCTKSLQDSLRVGNDGAQYYCFDQKWLSLLDWNDKIPKEYRFNPNISYGVFKDDRDGQVYKTVKIKDQTWFAENLNYSVGGRCYKEDEKKCDVGGRFYSFYELFGVTRENIKDLCYGDENVLCQDQQISLTKMKMAQGLCPDGWHVPDYDEWEKLFDAVGGQSVAGKNLKSQNGWSGEGMIEPIPFSSSSAVVWSSAQLAPSSSSVQESSSSVKTTTFKMLTENGNGTDAYGFSAIPAGSAEFEKEGLMGSFLSSTIDLRNSYMSVYLVELSYLYDDVQIVFALYTHSVRCIKDEDE